MRICYLANAGSIHTFRWISYFTRKGHKVSLVSLSPPQFDYKNIELKVVKKIRKAPGIISQLVNFIPLFFQLRKIIKNGQFDVFHALASGEGWLASLAGCRPLVLTIADPAILPDSAKPFYYNILNSCALKKADLITTDGENTRRAMIRLGANHNIIRIIRFGVDVEKFRPGKNEELKQRLFGERAKIIISTKPLRQECSIDTLIKAAPLILQEIPMAKFLIVGGGEEQENLMQLAKTLGISKAVHFTGLLKSEELPLYLQSADVYVGTSLVESGIAASTAEAMACQLPLVVSDSGDNALLIKDGENGFIFPPKNSKTLAEKFIILLKDEKLREKFAKANRKEIEEKNNYFREMEKMEKIYQSFKNERKN